MVRLTDQRRTGRWISLIGTPSARRFGEPTSDGPAASASLHTTAGPHRRDPWFPRRASHRSADAPLIADSSEPGGLTSRRTRAIGPTPMSQDRRCASVLPESGLLSASGARIDGRYGHRLTACPVADKRAPEQPPSRGSARRAQLAERDPRPDPDTRPDTPPARPGCAGPGPTEPGRTATRPDRDPAGPRQCEPNRTGRTEPNRADPNRAGTGAPSS